MEQGDYCGDNRGRKSTCLLVANFWWSLGDQLRTHYSVMLERRAAMAKVFLEEACSRIIGIRRQWVDKIQLTPYHPC
jgi:hypothetical protein